MIPPTLPPRAGEFVCLPSGIDLKAIEGQAPGTIVSVAEPRFRIEEIYRPEPDRVDWGNILGTAIFLGLLALGLWKLGAFLGLA